MAFELLKSAECQKGEATYTINLYFDSDTNMLKDEYAKNGESLYYLEYDASPFIEPENDANIDAVVAAFNIWYDQVGPDWRPEAFYLND